MLPVEMSSKIVEYADYLSLRHMSHVNEVYKALVRRRLEREARQIRAQLEGNDVFSLLLRNASDQELIEQIYHLNNYESADTSGITHRDFILFRASRTYRKINSIEVFVDESKKWTLGVGSQQVLHRYDGPAETGMFFSTSTDDQVNGDVNHESYYLNGKLGRLESQLPSRTTYYYASGNKHGEYWYVDGLLHREDGPAKIEYTDTGKKKAEFWYFNGQYHRPGDKPAVTKWSNDRKVYESWYTHGQRLKVVEYDLNGRVKKPKRR